MKGGLNMDNDFKKTLYCYYALYQGEEGFRLKKYEVIAKETKHLYKVANGRKEFPNLVSQISKDKVNTVLHSPYGYYSYYLVSDNPNSYDSFVSAVKEKLTEQIRDLQIKLNTLQKATVNLK